MRELNPLVQSWDNMSFNWLLHKRIFMDSTLATTHRAKRKANEKETVLHIVCSWIVVYWD